MGVMSAGSVSNVESGKEHEDESATSSVEIKFLSVIEMEALFGLIFEGTASVRMKCLLQ